LRDVQNIITISEYHKSRMGEKSDKVMYSYLWADFAKIDKSKVNKEKGSMLYCSSYDRGLEELLMKWDEVKARLGLKKLYVAYGWDFMEKMIAQDPNRARWRDHMNSLMDRDDIEHVGRLTEDEINKLYWKSEYWVLPLSNPDSELFCMNAIKAQYCGCKPVVRRIGALQETVNEFIDWDSLLGQKVGQSTLDAKYKSTNKTHAKKFGIKEAKKEWAKLLKG